MPLRVLGTAELSAGLAPDVRWNFRVTLSHWLLAGVFVGSVGSYMAVVARRLGGDEFTVALTIAVQFIGGIVAIAGPYLLRAVQPARAVAALWTIARLVFVAAIVIDSAGPFVVMLLVWSIIAMMGLPLYVGVTQAAFPRRVRGRFIGAAQAAMAVVVLLVSPLAGWLMDAVGATARCSRAAASQARWERWRCSASVRAPARLRFARPRGACSDRRWRTGAFGAIPPAPTSPYSAIC